MHTVSLHLAKPDVLLYAVHVGRCAWSIDLHALVIHACINVPLLLRASIFKAKPTRMPWRAFCSAPSAIALDMAARAVATEVERLIQADTAEPERREVLLRGKRRVAALVPDLRRAVPHADVHPRSCRSRARRRRRRVGESVRDRACSTRTFARSPRR